MPSMVPDEAYIGNVAHLQGAFESGISIELGIVTLTGCIVVGVLSWTLMCRVGHYLNGYVPITKVHPRKHLKRRRFKCKTDMKNKRYLVTWNEFKRVEGKAQFVQVQRIVKGRTELVLLLTRLALEKRTVNAKQL